MRETLHIISGQEDAFRSLMSLNPRLRLSAIEMHWMS